ncbi:MAG: hypothetical protein ACP5RH_06330 [Leptodesmis sp.]
MALLQRALILGQHHIFDPVQSIFNPPMALNCLGNLSGCGG